MHVLAWRAATANCDVIVAPATREAPTAEAVATLGLDPADDPGLLECEPWGSAREVFAPHQLRIEQRADRVELKYGEWTVRRTIHLDGRKPPAGEGATPMGYSVGRYEGDAPVIETTHIAANLAP